MHYIMNKDIPIMVVESGDILTNNLDKIPYSLRLCSKESDILDWIRDRVLQTNRAYAEEIYKTSQIPFNDKIQLAYYCNCTHLNDNYWIKDESSNLKYIDVSLFRNKYNTDMYEVALKGQSINHFNTGISAEYTGQGSYPKCFVNEDKEIYMYKNDSNLALEHEVIASNIAKVLGLKTVSYELVDFHGIKCTKSKIVSDETVNWETALSLAEYFSQSEYKIPQDFALQKLTAEYCNMIIFDALILNDDRHMKNWAFEFNADTNALIGLAPSYDYNNAFIGDKNTMSLLLFNEQRHVNILSAARMAYRDYYTTLNFNNLTNYIDSEDLRINKIALKNRILYITGQKSNQNDCYEK